MGLFLAFSLVLFNLISPASVFADSSAGFLPLVTYVPSGVAADEYSMTHVYDLPGTYPTYAYYSQASDDVPVYLALVQRANAASGTYDLYGFSKIEGGVAWRWREYHSYPGTTTYPVNSTSINVTQPGLDGVYYANLFAPSGTVDWVSSLPIYESISAAAAAFSTWSPSTSYAVPSSLDIPPGYVLYLKANGEYAFNLTCDFPVNSSAYSLGWADDNRRLGFATELPAAGQAFHAYLGTAIEWQPIPPYAAGSPPNALYPISRHAAYSVSQSIANNGWIVFYNPNQTELTAGLDKLVNSTVHMTNISGFTDHRLYPLAQGWMSFDGYVAYGSTSLDDYGTYYVYTEDPDSGVSGWIDPEGNYVTPAPGGQNDDIEPRSVIEIIEDFVGQVLELLSAPVSHIQQLVSAGSDFMRTLSQLYTWLPPEVSSTLISALIVVVVIGVFKVFL